MEEIDLVGLDKYIYDYVSKYDKVLSFIEEETGEKITIEKRKEKIAVELNKSLEISSIKENGIPTQDSKYNIDTIKFRAILRVVRRWYEENRHQSEPAPKYLSGIICPFEEPLKISFPISLCDKETNSIVFPKALSEFESPESMLPSNFNVSRLTEEEFKVVKEEIREVVSLTRAARINTLFLNNEGKSNHLKQTDVIWGDIDSIINKILNNSPEQNKLAIFDLNKSIEVALKILLSSQEKEFKKTHNLAKLLDCLNGRTKNAIAKEFKDYLDIKYPSISKYELGTLWMLLDKQAQEDMGILNKDEMLDDRDAAYFRYAEANETQIPFCFCTYYKMSLNALNIIINQLEPKYRVQDNLAFKIASDLK